MEQQPNGQPQPDNSEKISAKEAVKQDLHESVNIFSRIWQHVKNFLRGRFDLREDSAPQAEVNESVRKGIEFRGTNLWVLIFAVFIASLGLNVNSTAVIIGAMLVSPLMGPIIGIGFSLGTNDFELLKGAWRNFLLMVVVSLLTSTLYFLISPITTAQSELLARTTPTTYDVLIALFGGMAGFVAQTRKEKTYSVLSGVAIATALMPPLCTAGFGLATGNLGYFLGAIYLFTINAVFIALATYLIIIVLHYDKKVALDPARQKRNTRYIGIIIAVVTIPSVILGARIVRRTTFEDNVDRYVAQIFQFNKTMIVDYEKAYHYDGKKSKVEIKLVGEPLSNDVIDNVRAQMPEYGLSKTELIIKQADNNEKFDITKLQKSYSDIIDEKNNQINELRTKLSSLVSIDTLAVSDITREAGMVVDNIGELSLSKHVGYDTTGKPVDTLVVAVVSAADTMRPIDMQRLKLWLSVRTKNNRIRIINAE